LPQMTREAVDMETPAALETSSKDTDVVMRKLYI
jgi:hypothetical protein